MENGLTMVAFLKLLIEVALIKYLSCIQRPIAAIKRLAKNKLILFFKQKIKNEDFVWVIFAVS